MSTDTKERCNVKNLKDHRCVLSQAHTGPHKDTYGSLWKGGNR